jgi:ABC-type lipoprotein export system ATPase subunit
MGHEWPLPLRATPARSKDGIAAESVVPAVEIRDLTRTFMLRGHSINAVVSATATFTSGDFIAIFGVSGSGKSTLLSMMAGLDRPTSGTIMVLGSDLADINHRTMNEYRRRSLGMVFQFDNLIDEFTALENVLVPLLVGDGLTRRAATAEAMAVMGELGVAELVDRPVSELSGGQRQRVGIARALVGGRPILLADEPTGALDSANSDRLFQTLRALADAGRCVIVATHDQRVRTYATRVFEMVDGHLTETGRAERSQ